MKTVLLWTLALFMLAAPGVAEAITVSITATRVNPAGTATVTPTVTFTDGAGNPAVALACTSNVSGVANSTRGNTACTRTISVGGTTVTLRDISTANRARVYRVDAGSDILNVAGLLATSGSTAPPTDSSAVTLKISYASSVNEFTPLNYNLYAYTAAMSGNFFASNGAAARACNSIFATPPHCLTLKLTANGATVNQFGDNAVATVNVHSLPTGGAFGPPTHPSETKSIACGTSGVLLSCKPSLQGELTAIYKGGTETLKLVGGAAVGGSNLGITEGGVRDTAVDVGAPEGAVNEFVDYTQEATLHATLAQDGGRFPMLQDGANLPLWWNLEKVDGFTPLPLEPTRLRSIVTNADLFDDGAYVSFVPTQGQVQARDLNSLVVDFDWVTPNCSNSLFVELQLETLQVIKIFLGCDPLSLSGVDLVTFAGNNVQLPNGATTNFKSMLSQFGGVDLRAISVFLTKTTVDQEVALNSFTIGAFKTTFERAGSRSPIFVDQKCDFPGLNEFTMRVTPVDANHNPAGPSFIWGDSPGETFVKAQDQPVAGDCQLRTQIPVTSFPAHDRESGWRFELLYNLVPVGQGDINLF